MLPSRSPISSLWANPSHPPKDELLQLLLTEAKSLQLPETKAIVNEEGTSTESHSPLYNASQAL
jgi:hypothetical protein